MLTRATKFRWAVAIGIGGLVALTHENVLTAALSWLPGAA